MTIGNILDFARFQLDDTEKDYKFPNEELCLYYNDAEAEACRRGGLIYARPSLVKLTGVSNISFDATAKTITKTNGGFLSAGVVSEFETFEPDDIITITGTSSNNGDFTIMKVTDTVITVKSGVVDESNTNATIEATRTTTRLPMIANVHTYKLHPKTLMVFRAKIESMMYPLTQKTIEGLDADIVVNYSMYNMMFNPYSMGNWETLTGNVIAYIEDIGRIRFISPPTSSDIAWLHISRLPKHTITIKDFNASPEIPEMYHTGLVDWICYRAFSKPDAVTSDSTKAKDFEASFEARFGKRPSAIEETNRRLYPRNSTMRPRSFGF